MQSALHSSSLRDQDSFWSDAARSVSWSTAPKTTLDPASPVTSPRWYPDGRISACYNAVDRHVEQGNGERVAIVFDSPFTKGRRDITYAELKEEVETLAGVLRDFGMPMVPEAIFGMLATVRLGAVHSVVFGGFAPQELVEDCKPKVILYGACGFEPSRIVPYKPLVDAALNMCKHKVPFKLVFERPQCPVVLDHSKGERSLAGELAHWKTSRKPGQRVGCVAVGSNDPLYLLYTSGSTGTPKGVVRETGGYLVALRWAMSNIFGMSPSDTFFAASDIGWVVGHSFIVYGPLTLGCTTVLYEGKPIMPGANPAAPFWRMVQQHRINCIFTAPTAMRAIKREDPNLIEARRHDLTTLRNVFLAGERCDPDTAKFFAKELGVPIRDNFWQTETGWPITAASAFVGGEGTPVVVGSAGPPVAGYDVRVLVSVKEKGEGDEDFKEMKEAGWGVLGNLVVKLPLPPGCFTTLWNNHEGYLKSYFTKFPGYFDLTDAGLIDEGGNVHIMGRTDDVLNIAGHRLSAGGMEEVVSTHQAVAECAVVGMADALKGEKPLCFMVLKKGVSMNDVETIKGDLISAIREKIGAIACFQRDNIYTVEKLPKTRSGKILRRTLRNIANGEKYIVPATIEDDLVLPNIEALFSVKPKL
ncbi:hypothetical protein HK101_011793 [Irineochytrium annulatum]|nr:hypothetical protein HK101_011793 [Irineochytrium annulatum]